MISSDPHDSLTLAADAQAASAIGAGLGASIARM
jgi:hypothetical protein